MVRICGGRSLANALCGHHHDVKCWGLVPYQRKDKCVIITTDPVGRSYPPVDAEDSCDGRNPEKCPDRGERNRVQSVACAVSPIHWRRPRRQWSTHNISLVAEYQSGLLSPSIALLMNMEILENRNREMERA